MRPSESPATPPLARSAINRDAQVRLDSGKLDAVRNSPEARFVLLNDDRMLAHVQASSDEQSRVVESPAESFTESFRTSVSQPTELVFLTANEAKSAIGVAEAGELPETFYLGRTLDDGGSQPPDTPVFVLPCTADAVVSDLAARDGVSSEWVTLRTCASQLNDRDAGIFTTALALARWNESTGFAPESGASTRPAQGGWMRIDSQSGSEIYPRTDPAVIVLITDADDRVLLGSNILWPENQYSLLAGFVEAGESIETAVHREIAEEAGIRLVNLQYQCSQPWPFPRSLMLGFRARLAPDMRPDEVTPDDTELVDLRWFTRAEIRSARSGIRLPGEASIARFLINAWLNEQPESAESHS